MQKEVQVLAQVEAVRLVDSVAVEALEAVALALLVQVVQDLVAVEVLHLLPLKAVDLVLVLVHQLLVKVGSGEAVLNLRIVLIIPLNGHH